MVVTLEPTVGQFSWGYPYRQRVRASFVIDGNYYLKLNIDCSGNCYSYVAGSYTVDKIAGTVQP